MNTKVVDGDRLFTMYSADARRNEALRARPKEHYGPRPGLKRRKM